MNPLIILAALAGGALLLFSGKQQDMGSSGTTVKIPTQITSVKTPVGTVSVKPPTADSTESGTTIEVPETVITAAPADTSLLLTSDELALLTTGTNDQIYAAALQTSHQAFLAAAALSLAGKGDSRAPTLTQMLRDWG
jgi:hypothetical protein